MARMVICVECGAYKEYCAKNLCRPCYAWAWYSGNPEFASLIQCKCGCGQKVTKQGNRFIQGHNTRIYNPMENPTSRAKIMGKNHPMYGKYHTKEAREKMRAAAAARGDENHPAKRPEVRAKISRALLALGENHPSKRPEVRAKFSAAVIGKTGKLHPSWKGGLSHKPYGYEFNKELKSRIRERDNFICQKCNTPEEELGHTLSVHHVDYDKENNDENNLISLCKPCNSRANGNREHWQKFFRCIVEARILTWQNVQRTPARYSL